MAWLALLPLAAPAAADNIVANGSFESGELDPWVLTVFFDPAGAEVLAPGRTDLFALHLDAAEYDDHYRLVQSLATTPTNLITEVSLWTFCPTPRWGHSPVVVLDYTDGTTSELLFGLVDEWTRIDATASILPGKLLEGIELVWDGIGDEGPGSEVFFDDVVVNAVPAPGTAGLAVAGAVCAAMRRRRRTVTACS